MWNLLLVAAALLAGESRPEPGSIAGIVVNASRDGAPVAGAEVALRVKLEGRFVVAAETATDTSGRFVFDDVPADPEYVYLPGANWQTVHYPGERIRLSRRRRHAEVRIAVHEAVESPNPLLVRKHEIVIEPEPGALRVTESMRIENPTETTYIGRPARREGRAATLTLSVPSDFVRTTFHKEFYGRRFTLIDGKLVTDIPFTPGTRELKFTYVLPNSARNRLWTRHVDLPTSHVRVAVRGETAGNVVCNLQRAPKPADAAVAFTAESLPAGRVIRVELDHMPVAFMTYARPAALVVLFGAIAVTALLLRRRNRTNPQSEPGTAASRRRRSRVQA